MLLDDLNAALTEPVGAEHVRHQLERQKRVLSRLGVEAEAPVSDVDALVEERTVGLEEAYLEEDPPQAQIFNGERILGDFQKFVAGQRRLNELRQLLTPGDHVTARALDRAPTGRPEQRKQHARLRQVEDAPSSRPGLIALFALLGSRTF